MRPLVIKLVLVGIALFVFLHFKGDLLIAQWLSKNYVEPKTAQQEARKKSQAGVNTESLTWDEQGGSDESFMQYSCPDIRLNKTAITKEKKVYSWKDASGRTHFSDEVSEAKTKKITDLSDKYKVKADYFQLTLIDHGKILSASAKGEIKADIQQIYKTLVSDLEIENLQKISINVRIMPDEASFVAYRNLHAPKLKTVSGFYSPVLNEAVVIKMPEEYMRSVIRHEATHVINASLFGRSPIWFNEGLAEYFERMEVAGLGRSVKHSKSSLRFLQTQRPLTLQHYFSIPYADWYGGDIRVHYSYAWSLMHHLLSDKKGKAFFAVLVNQMAENYCQPQNDIGLINQFYPGGFQAFEQDWVEWIENPERLTHYY